MSNSWPYSSTHHKYIDSGLSTEQKNTGRAILTEWSSSRHRVLLFLFSSSYSSSSSFFSVQRSRNTLLHSQSLLPCYFFPKTVYLRLHVPPLFIYLSINSRCFICSSTFIDSFTESTPQQLYYFLSQQAQITFCFYRRSSFLESQRSLVLWDHGEWSNQNSSLHRGPRPTNKSCHCCHLVRVRLLVPSYFLSFFLLSLSLSANVFMSRHLCWASQWSW